jgi:hypothetical protein
MIGRLYYHGTQTATACSIMQQGFKLAEPITGRNLGAGLYLSASPGFAAAWGPVVIRCALKKGTRILWHTPVDQRTIKYLKREFGAGITKPAFHKLIPTNKQLTKSEVAHLWNSLIHRHYLNSRNPRRDFLPRLARAYPFIYKHLRRHGYDGFGIMDEEWPEIFLFNPSNAKPVSAHSHTSTGWRTNWVRENVRLSEALTLDQLDEKQVRPPESLMNS